MSLSEEVAFYTACYSPWHPGKVREIQMLRLRQDYARRHVVAEARWARAAEAALWEDRHREWEVA